MVIKIFHGDDKMKRTLLVTLAMAALGSASALAADLPQRPAYKALR